MVRPQPVSAQAEGDLRAQAQHWETGDSLDNHVELIRRQVHTSLADPETRLLAAAITSGSFDDFRDPRTGQSVPAVPYHGRHYRGARDWSTAARLCAMRDERCEITQIWNFCVLNIRYAQDQAGEDTYCTLRSTLEAGSGDCDDATVALATLCGAMGYHSMARIISVRGNVWDHVFPVIKTRSGWLPLDMTEKGKRPGWEYKRAARTKDFALV